MLVFLLQLLCILALTPFSLASVSGTTDRSGVPDSSSSKSTPVATTTSNTPSSTPNSTQTKGGNSTQQQPDLDSDLVPILVQGITLEGTGNASVSLFQQARKAGYTKLGLRGYFESWGSKSGGAIDPTFYQNSRNALKAGYDEIDVLWFPCSGSKHTCKSYQDQANQLDKYLDAHFKDIIINRVYINIENDTQANNWDYGYKGNQQQAVQMCTAAAETWGEFGIMSSFKDWFQIFGNPRIDLNNNIPLWWREWDGVGTGDDVLRLKAMFGGWSVGVAKNYKGTSPTFDNKFGLNVHIDVKPADGATTGFKAP